MLSEHRVALAPRLLAWAPAAAFIALTVALALAGGPWPIGWALAAGAIVLGAWLNLRLAALVIVVRQDCIERWGRRGLLWRVPWDTARGLFVDPTRLVRGAFGETLSLISASNRRCSVPRGLEGADRLAPLVLKLYGRARLPALTSFLEVGHDLQFGGRLALSVHGLLAADRRGSVQVVPLAEVGEALLKSGELVITRRGSPEPIASLPAAEVPDAPLFATLVAAARAMAAA